MLNIIAIVLAMVLMIAAILAGISYLGPMFTDNSSRIELANYLNKGAQIHGALGLYEAENEGAMPPGDSHAQVVALMQAGYLKQVPEAQWEIDTGKVYRDIGTADQCYKLNAAANLDMSSPAIASYKGCPPCDNVDFSGYPACTNSDNDPSFSQN